MGPWGAVSRCSDVQSHRIPDLEGTLETVLARGLYYAWRDVCVSYVIQRLLKSQGNLPETVASCLERMQKSSVKAESKTVYFIKQKSVVKVLGNSCGSRRELCGKSSPRGLYDIPEGRVLEFRRLIPGGTLRLQQDSWLGNHY